MLRLEAAIPDIRGPADQPSRFDLDAGHDPQAVRVGAVDLFQGVNSYTDFLAGDPDMEGTYGGYDGPFPPWNDERLHHYHFVVYALDADLDLKPGLNRAELLAAIQGHVVGQGELVAVYER